MKKTDTNLVLRLPRALHQLMLDDLHRPHDFAAERVGFLYTKSKVMPDQSILVIATDYVPVDNDHYIDDDRVGAKINSTAIRTAMQESLRRQGGCFHVHLHDHRGRPSPSQTDNRSLPGVIESFANVAPTQANGILILSRDSFFAAVKVQGKPSYIAPRLISAIGKSLITAFGQDGTVKNPVLDRQSFLGEDSSFLFENIRVGVIGYGGGGSHIGQQLAHLGVSNITFFDDDVVECTNLNRLVGARFSDVKENALKTSVAERTIKSILPTAKVTCINHRWQDRPEALQLCDVVFGCVDSYTERQQAEAECRRYLIPYIDIGMDVHQVEDEPYSISGQVILSAPGQPCLSCLGFLTEKKLSQEAARYGKVGGRPQVVWPNGVLASTAVGLFVNLITNWTQDEELPVYLSYSGNTGLIQEHVRAQFAPKDCAHFPFQNVGEPVFTKL